MVFYLLFHLLHPADPALKPKPSSLLPRRSPGAPLINNGETSLNSKPTMKQELPTTHTTPPPTRSRISRARATEPPNGSSPSSRPRPKPPQNEPDMTQNRARRTLLVNRVKPVGDDVGVRKETGAVDQFARPRRRPDTVVDGKTEELQKRLDASEGLVKELQSEASGLKAQVQKLESLNAELGSQNKLLVGKLAAAESKITVFENLVQGESIKNDLKTSEFSNARNLIANKLDNLKIRREIVRKDSNVKVLAVEVQPKVPIVMNPPPPPPVRSSPGAPPPPPPPPSAMAKAAKSPSALVELYNSLAKRDLMKSPLASGNRANKAHNSIVGELQNRSSHLLAIKADVENKRDFIEHLIEKVQSAAYMDVEDVLTFVGCLDQELSTLADERAVLKHFNWPEKKADALREAAVEYRDLKRLEHEASFFEDDSSLLCEASLKKIEFLLDKMERSIQRLIKLRGTSMHSYKECKIPVDWMLDSGMVKKMKLASVKLAKVYIHRLSTEHELLRHSERESVLCQGVRFAYRAHQFAGGLDPETMHTFEELRARLQAHGKGSSIRES